MNQGVFTILKVSSLLALINIVVACGGAPAGGSSGNVSVDDNTAVIAASPL